MTREDLKHANADYHDAVSAVDSAYLHALIFNTPEAWSGYREKLNESERIFKVASRVARKVGRSERANPYQVFGVRA